MYRSVCIDYMQILWHFVCGCWTPADFWYPLEILIKSLIIPEG